MSNVLSALEDWHGADLHAGLIARIEALEAQVRELRDDARMRRLTQEAGAQLDCRERMDNPDNAKCACGMSASGQHDEVCPSHE